MRVVGKCVWFSGLLGNGEVTRSRLEHDLMKRIEQRDDEGAAGVGDLEPSVLSSTMKISLGS